MLNVPNLLALSQQIGMRSNQLPGVFSLQCCSFFLFFMLSSSLLSISQSYCIYFSSRTSSFLFCSICYFPLSKHLFFFVFFFWCFSFPDSPTSASSYYRSGDRGGQSRANTDAGLCFSRRKPLSHSPLE